MTQQIVKVIKLITGEEIIGFIIDGQEESRQTKNLVFIRGAMSILTEYDPKLKAHSVSLIDWVPSIADDYLPIEKSMILTIGNPNINLEDHYYDLIIGKMSHSKKETEEEKNKKIQDELRKFLENYDFKDDEKQ